LIFFLYYAAMTLVTGTLSGLAHPITSAVTTALLSATILVGVWRRPTARLCPGDDLACAGFLGAAFLTAIFSICPERSLHLAVPFVAATVLFYLVLDSNREELAPAMALTATLAALIGLGGWLMGATPRVTAPFGLHHYAAGFLLLHLPITWTLARRESSYRRLWIAALLLQAAAIAATRSIAAAGVRGLMLLWTQRRRPVALVAILAALAAVAVLVPRTHELLTRGEDPSLSTENRLRYLQTGVAMLKARPLGWGLGSVPLVSAPFRPQTPDMMPEGEVLPHVHNLPLHLTLETGIFGMIAAAWFLWRARSLNIAPYLLFAMADYQLDIPALLIAFAAVAGFSATAAKSRPLGKVWQVALLCAAALAPVASLCGWDDFLGHRYVQASAKLADLIPVSSAAGASLVEAAQYREAIPYLERAERLDRYYTLAWFHHGRALLAVGDRDHAATAFAQALLTQPVTVFAENWDRDVYAQAQRQAVADLDTMRISLSTDSRTQYRYNELHAFLAANPTPPAGEFRAPYSEITDANWTRSTSLLIFRRLEQPSFTSTVYVMLPNPDFYIPPGIGYLRLR
jgi:hypothetical protein